MGPKVPPESNEDFYNTSNPSQGRAVVLNYTSDRPGSEKDTKDIRTVLENLNFEVEIWQDLTIMELNKNLVKVATMDHTDSNCFVMVVMAHGENNCIHINGQAFGLERLWENIVGSNCPSLIAKPKLFFIQSCRGTSEERGDVEVDATPETVSPVNIKIPMYADLLVMYASYENYVAYRHSSEGSLFIQAMCDVLSGDIRGKELLSLLTKVSFCVAYGYPARVGDKVSGKQIPVITSMLTKQFYFVDSMEQTPNASVAPTTDEQRHKEDTEKEVETNRINN